MIAASPDAGDLGVNLPPVILPIATQPVAQPQLPTATIAPQLPTAQIASTFAASAPSGSGDIEARGLPQEGIGAIGMIVEPHPQPIAPTPGEQPAATPGEQPTTDEGTNTARTAYFGLDDPAFADFAYAPYYGEGGGLADDASTPKILRGWDFVRSVQRHSAAYDIDALAVIANAEAEGLGGGIGDSGNAFGPWQIWAEDGRLPQFVGQPKYSAYVQAWAWTDNGIEYAIRSMRAGGASGLKGHAAVEKIVRGFEIPADIPSAIRIRDANYDALRRWGATVWDHIAAIAGGPSLTSTSPVQEGTQPLPVETPKPAVSEAWRGLMKTLGTDMRFAANHALTASNEIVRMVRQ